jgi:hypothetical protein
VNTPISTALNKVFEAQNPRPTCMIWSALGFVFSVIGALPLSTVKGAHSSRVGKAMEYL